MGTGNLFADEWFLIIIRTMWNIYLKSVQYVRTFLCNIFLKYS